MKPKGERPAYLRAAARSTAILDSIGFPRTTPVVWDDERGAFVVVYAISEGVERVRWLGPTPTSAVRAALRERHKVLAPARRKAAREGFAAFLQVLGVIAPLIGKLIPPPRSRAASAQPPPP